MSPSGSPDPNHQQGPARPPRFSGLVKALLFAGGGIVMFLIVVLATSTLMDRKVILMGRFAGTEKSEIEANNSAIIGYAPRQQAETKAKSEAIQSEVYAQANAQTKVGKFEKRYKQIEPPLTDDAFISCRASGASEPHGVSSFFPWPPPQGSDEQDFTEPVVSAVRQTVRGPVLLKSVDLFLTDRLRQVGYISFTYFSTPHRDGYAAITRLEQINETGSHLQEPARFSKPAAESASLIYNFFKGLVSLPEGRFRLFVFFVSSDPVSTQYAREDVTLEDAKRWINLGCSGLPPELGGLRLTDNHKILLRVYEFANSLLLSRSDAIPLAKQLSLLGLELDDRRK